MTSKLTHQKFGLLGIGSFIIIFSVLSTSDVARAQVQVCESGVEQSPIDISLKPFKPIFATPVKFFINRNYDASDVRRFSAQYNGVSAQFTLDPTMDNSTKSLMVIGNEPGNDYRLASFHFHWGPTNTEGSEHTINNRSYPLALHMVHHKSTYSSLADAVSAINDREAIAVMAIFFKISPFPNIQLRHFIDALDLLQEPGRVTQVDCEFQSSSILPTSLLFATYSGSLTTGNCEETVIWNVFLQPSVISESQIAAFRRLSNRTGTFVPNFRPTVPLNGRRLQFFRAKGLFVRDYLFDYAAFIKALIEFQSAFLHGLVNFIKYLMIL